MVKYRFSYVTVTPESAEVGEYADNGWYSPPDASGCRFSANTDGDTEGNDAYHEARASEAVRHILNVIGGYQDMVATHGERLLVWGAYRAQDARTAIEERRTAEVIAPTRLMHAMMRKLRAAC
jgi:hypothetical protein